MPPRRVPAPVAWLLAAAVTGWAVHSGLAEDLSRFELIPSHLADAGAVEIVNLKSMAAEEGFFNKMFGTDCWTQALKVVEHECRKLTPEQKARFTIALFNCHMRQSGRKTAPCPHETPIKDCTSNLDIDDFIVYTTFMTHVDSMCLFILNQDFDRRTEHLINTLHSATASAAESLSGVATDLRSQAESLSQVGVTLDGMASAQSRIVEDLTTTTEGVQRLEEHGKLMGDVLQDSLRTGDAILRKQQMVSESLLELESQQLHAARVSLEQWKVAEERALSLEQRQVEYLQIQDAIVKEAGELAHHTAGLSSAMELVLDYERRSDKLLLMVLGRSYTLEDVLFYATALGATLFATTLPSTSTARMPGLMLLAGAAAVERLAISYKSPLLQVEQDGRVVLPVPQPSLFLEAAREGNWSAALSPEPELMVQLDFKWLVRRVWMTAALALVLRCLLSYRNYQRDNFRLLRRLEDKLQVTEREIMAAITLVQAEMRATRHAILDGGGRLDPPPHVDRHMRAASDSLITGGLHYPPTILPLDTLHTKGAQRSPSGTMPPPQPRPPSSNHVTEALESAIAVLPSHPLSSAPTSPGTSAVNTPRPMQDAVHMSVAATPVAQGNGAMLTFSAKAEEKKKTTRRSAADIGSADEQDGGQPAKKARGAAAPRKRPAQSSVNQSDRPSSKSRLSPSTA